MCGVNTSTAPFYHSVCVTGSAYPLWFLLRLVGIAYPFGVRITSRCKSFHINAKVKSFLKIVSWNLLPSRRTDCGVRSTESGEWEWEQAKENCGGALQWATWSKCCILDFCVLFRPGICTQPPFVSLSLITSHSPTPWGHLLPVCVCSSLSLSFSVFLCVCVTYCSRGFGSSHWAFGCHSSYWEIGNARPPFTAAAAVAVAWPCRLTYCTISEINFNIVASSKQKFPFFGFYKSVNLVFSLQSHIFKVNSQIWSPVFKFSWLLSNKLMVIYKCYTKKTIFLN